MGEKCLGKIGINVKKGSQTIFYSVYENNELKIIPLDNRFARNFSYILANNITPSKITNLFIMNLKEFVQKL